MKRKLKIVIGLTMVGLMAPAARAALSVISTATAPSGVGGYGSAIMDQTDGFAYFGSSTTYVSFSSTYSTVTPMTLSPFGLNLGFGYFPQVTDLSAAAFDSGTGFGYFVSSQAPSVVEMFPARNGGIGSPTSGLTFQAGQNWVGTAVIDSTNHFAYFGTQTSPSIVVKVQIPDGVSVTSMTIISSITLPSGLDFLSASVIDTTNGFAYFGSSAATGAVAKIQLSNFTLAGTLTFNSGEGGVGSAVIDTTHEYAYFGTHDSPAKIVKILLSNFTRVGSVTLPAGQNDLTSAVIDPALDYAYFGTNTSPGFVVPLLLSNFNASTALSLATGQNYLKSAVIDTVNSYAYFGTYTTPGGVIQVDLLAGLPTIILQPTDANVHPGDTAFFSVSATGRNLSYQWQLNGTAIPGATSAVYSRVAATTDDGDQFNCVVTGANGSVTSSTVQLTIIPVVRAYPNPWRSDRHTGVPITFDGLLANSTVKIFNLAAHWVKTLPPASGTVTWDRTNDAGQTVASGYYFYIVTGRTDQQTATGKLAIIH
jgi:hypothetical protein